MKKTLFFFLFWVFFLFSSQVVLAEAVLHVHLFYDSTQKTLVFDKTFSPVISLDKNKNIYITEFDNQYSSQGQYEMVFLDSNNTIMDQIQFNPQIGSFVIDVPDFSITKTIAIRKTGSSSYFLKQDIGQYVSCNNNSICEYEKGETDVSCIPDCGNSQPKYSTKTTQLLHQGNGVISDPVSGKIILTEKGTQSNDGSFIVPTPANNNTSTTVNNQTGQTNNTIPLLGDQTTNTGNQQPATTDQTLLIALVVSGVLFVGVILFLLFRRLKKTQ
jgi:hypothetical protein